MDTDTGIQALIIVYTIVTLVISMLFSAWAFVGVCRPPYLLKLGGEIWLPVYGNAGR